MNFRLIAPLLCLVVVACSRAPDGTESEVGLLSLFDPVAANPSLCGSPAIPYPNNALFSGTTDATLNIPNPAGAPFVTAANLTDGFSTTASIFTDVLGAVDFDTAPASVLIFEANAGVPPRFLVHGVDFTIQPSIAMAQVSGTGHSTGTCTGTMPAKFQPIADQRSRLLIEPLKPLKPSTTYIVAVTRDLKSKDGVAALPNEFFKIANSDTKVCKLSGGESGSEALCTDAGAGAAAAAATGEVVLALLNATQLSTIETLRRSLVRPTVTALKGGHQALKGTPLNDEDLMIAWSFTTQSVGLTLSRLNTATDTFNVVNTGLNTTQISASLANTANVYAGTVAVEYYLGNSGGNVNSAVPLSTYWTRNGTLNSTSPPAFSGTVSCNMLAPPVSTTICYPDPTALSTETIPVIVTVPNGNTGLTKPDNGWPVVVFQHGITRNRTDMFALAPTLASAGFVTVAIDMPLHGVTDAANPFYRNQLFTGSPADVFITGERTFNLDLINNGTGAAGPDGTTDPSGTHFVNLSSLITSRDNLRQAEADIMHIVRSMAALDLDGNPGALEAADIDETRISFAGQSLGAIVGTTVLGVMDNTLIQSASLNVPGGGIAKLLDASASFGPRVAAGLAASFVFEGTDTYETFIRFAQHLVDPADPINYATAANSMHALHVTQVIGDAVVPNSAGSTCPSPLPSGLTATATSVDAIGTATASGVAGGTIIAACPALTIPADAPLAPIRYQHPTLLTGYLSGTDALVRIMGITNTVTMGNVNTGGTVDLSDDIFTAQPSAGADTLVQFAPDTAEHGTLLTPLASSYDSNGDGTPDTSSAAQLTATENRGQFRPGTCAMQKQTATFLATNGTVIPVGGSCP